MEIKRRIKHKTKLTASAGVSYNKFLAKLASDMKKPDGLFAVTPEQGADFVARLPIGQFHGIGKATEARMKQLGIKTGADMRQWSMAALVNEFGKVGEHYCNMAHAVDKRVVTPSRVRKSVSTEKTFATDISASDQMMREIMRRAREVALLLVEKELTGRTVTLKIKFSDFQLITRSRTLEQPLSGLNELNGILAELFSDSDAASRPVRLIGVGVSNLCGSKMGRMPRQMDLLKDC